MTRAAYVYRAFDDAGLLLYVGCSVDVDRRMNQHRAVATWPQYCADVRTEGPYTRGIALDIEATAIAEESPYFNAQPEHHLSVQRNKHEARQQLDRLGITPGLFGDERAEDYYLVLHAAENALRERFPVVDDNVRHAMYLDAKRRSA